MGSNPGEKSQFPDSEPVKPIEGDEQAVQGETIREKSPTSVFVNSEPMREDQVQNAVKFLSHPKVKGSPVIYRRSFLEKKGLTKEEIDEAFRRVPDPPSTITSTPAANPNQDSQAMPVANVQPNASTQSTQPAVAAPSSVISRVTTLRPTSFHWSHALYAIGFLAASGTGTVVLFKNLVVPRLKSWIRKVVLEGDDSSAKQIISTTPSEEVAAATMAASDVVKASQQMLSSINEERRYFEAIMSKLNVQMEEVKSMNTAIQKLEGPTLRNEPSNNSWRTPLANEEDRRLSGALSQVNTDINLRPYSAPASVEPLAAPHPKSYMEIMEMVQRGEKPPGIKEINDLPPNPNQPPSNPRLAPRTKPWENTQQNGSYYGDNKVPNSQVNGDSTEPWWQRNSAKITEIEPDDELRIASSQATHNQRIAQRSWVPPQPPPIAMAEAAAAIRQPKSLAQKEKPNDEIITQPSGELDELQRITKISELGGEVGNNGVSSEPSFTEIEEVQEY